MVDQRECSPAGISLPLLSLSQLLQTAVCFGDTHCWIVFATWMLIWMCALGKAPGCSVCCKPQWNASRLPDEYVSVCMSPLWASQNNVVSVNQHYKVLYGTSRCLLSWSQGSSVKICTSHRFKEGEYGKQRAGWASWEAPEDHLPSFKLAKQSSVQFFRHSGVQVSAEAHIRQLCTAAYCLHCHSSHDTLLLDTSVFIYMALCDLFNRFTSVYQWS